jgi:hypothetical protein
VLEPDIDANSGSEKDAFGERRERSHDFFPTLMPRSTVTATIDEWVAFSMLCIKPRFEVAVEVF